MLYYFSSSLFNWWHAWEENPLLLSLKSKRLRGTFLYLMLAYPGRVKLELQRETFQDEPLGTEFSSKSNTPAGLKFDTSGTQGLPPRSRFEDLNQEESQESEGQLGAGWRPPARSGVLQGERNHSPALLLDGACGQQQTEKPSMPTDKPSRPVPEKERAAVPPQLLTARSPSCFNLGPKGAVQRALQAREALWEL